MTNEIGDVSVGQKPAAFGQGRILAANDPAFVGVDVERRRIAGLDHRQATCDQRLGLLAARSEDLCLFSELHELDEGRSAVRQLVRSIPDLAEFAVDETRPQVGVEQHHAILALVERAAQDEELAIRGFHALPAVALLLQGALRPRTQEPDDERRRRRHHKKGDEAKYRLLLEAEQLLRPEEGEREADGDDGADQPRNRAADIG